MSTSARPYWIPPLSFVAITFIICVISFFKPLVPLAVTGQLLLLLIILRAFWYWPPMHRCLHSMPAAHVIVFSVLLGAMILGHYSLNSRAYFPYIAWEIFPFMREEDPVACRELIATTASGKKERLLVEQLFPSITQFNLPLDEKGAPLPSMNALVQALARVYGERHADDPVRRVDLVVLSVPLHPPAGESNHQPSCEFIKSYDITSDR
jgi:hypothetical protein